MTDINETWYEYPETDVERHRWLLMQRFEIMLDDIALKKFIVETFFSTGYKTIGFKSSAKLSFDSNN
jgi:hypothetical protein